jgi:hypothetical protein
MKPLITILLSLAIISCSENRNAHEIHGSSIAVLDKNDKILQAQIFFFPATDNTTLTGICVIGDMSRNLSYSAEEPDVWNIAGTKIQLAKTEGGVYIYNKDGSLEKLLTPNSVFADGNSFMDFILIPFRERPEELRMQFRKANWNLVTNLTQ